MTESVQETAAGEAHVDTTRKYALNAGKCEQCGHYKTWDFRVLNAKTGKQIPGHVTADGYKIGDGDCPYWARIRATNERRGTQRKGGATALDAEMARATGKQMPIGGAGTLAAAIQGIPSSSSAAAVPAPASSAPRQAENGITVMIHGIPVVVSVAEALNVCKQIVDELIRVHSPAR